MESRTSGWSPEAVMVNVGGSLRSVVVAGLAATAVAQLPVAVIDFGGRRAQIDTLTQALTSRDRGPG